ncbi:MAG: hypothetical protein E7590_07390 [Ruminococcaceae bacterium]|nr:hypothetical protein [Oscillospiraceae bacterium]
MKITQSKKFRHGSVSVALTVVIIAAVILINGIFTALSDRFTWYIDMTAEQIYTLSDEAKELLNTVDPSRQVTIIFCSPKRDLEADPSLRYPLYTVTEMTEKYDNIHVKYVDWLTNPSAVSQYKESSGQSINSYSIIVTSTFEATNPTTNALEEKTQSRVYALNALYTYDSTGQSVIGYNGEQRLVSGILAVTQVETPVACVTINHEEKVNSALLNLLYETGYEVKAVDLSAATQTETDPATGEKKQIPTAEYMKDCRLLVIFDPQEDFYTVDGEDEIAILDALLAKRECAAMVFFDHETPEMPRLEAFLKEWGVEIARHTNEGTGQVSNLLIKDTRNSFDPDGIINKAVYAEKGLGYSITKQLLEATSPKPAVFKYTGAIRMPADTNWTVTTSEKDENGDSYTYGAYYANGVNRALYDVFTSSNSAFAEAGGDKLDESAPFKYMTVTRETLASGGNSYLLACASTEFASAGALDSSYANHTVLTRACHAMGGAQVSVSLDCKYFTDTEIDSITASAANQYTIVLTVVPALAIFITGIVIMVRRKYA